VKLLEQPLFKADAFLYFSLAFDESTGVIDAAQLSFFTCCSKRLTSICEDVVGLILFRDTTCAQSIVDKCASQ